MPLPLVSYELSLDGQTTPIWIVQGFSSREGINLPPRISLDIATTDNSVDTEALLGANAALKLFRENFDPQYFYGIVARVDYVRQTSDLLRLHLEIMSAFELLRQEINSRIWQSEAPLDIVTKLLGERFGPYKRSVEPGQVGRGKRAREYCVQYRESTFDFVSRLLEEEGISYTFVHDSAKQHEVLTLHDKNDQYPKVVVDTDPLDPAPPPSDTLPIVEDNESEVSSESIQEIEWTRAMTSTAVLRRDFDWKDPKHPLSAKLDVTDERNFTRRFYTHNDRRYEFNDLAECAADLEAANSITGGVCRGEGNAAVLRAGVRFKLAGHAREDLDQEYIVMAIRHFGHPDGGGENYRNMFECVRASTEIRPAQVTAKPRVNGPHTAIVTGDEEIETDKFGRIQVQFTWEEVVKFAAGSSCWIRVAQSWAGQGWGTQFIPRIGMEVVVEFLEGNPDRPLVVGCVYNGENKHPFLLPDHKTQSGWRTRSSPMSSGHNELRFEDAAGSEEVYLRAEKNLRTLVQNNESRSIGGGRSTTIENDDQLTLKKGDYKLTIEKGDRTTEITEGSNTLIVKKGGTTQKAQLGTSVIDAKDVHVIASASVKLECGGSSITLTPSEIVLVSPMIKLN